MKKKPTSAKKPGRKMAGAVLAARLRVKAAKKQVKLIKAQLKLARAAHKAARTERAQAELAAQQPARPAVKRRKRATGKSGREASAAASRVAVPGPADEVASLADPMPGDATGTTT